MLSLARAMARDGSGYTSASCGPTRGFYRGDYARNSRPESHRQLDRCCVRRLDERPPAVVLALLFVRDLS